MAACTFDKKICIFDFFSGSLMVCVDSGHSELITSIRFSPNGKHLLTVAGDGSIMIWKVGADLVTSMQDRIIELYTNVKNKQTEQLNTHVQSIDRSLPAAPPITQRSDYPPVPPPPAPFPDLDTSNNTESSSASKLKPPVKNSWASRQNVNGSVEVFGKNVDAASDLKNKLTMELTATTIGLVNPALNSPGHARSPVPASSPNVHNQNAYSDRRDNIHAQSAISMVTASTISDVDVRYMNDMPSANSMDRLSRSTSERLAISIEYKFDDVMHGDKTDDEHLYDTPSDDDTITVDEVRPSVGKANDGFSDDEEDDAYGDKREFVTNINTITPRTKKALDNLELTKALKEAEREDVYVTAESEAVRKLDSLEQSVSELENWLEEKVRIRYRLII